MIRFPGWAVPWLLASVFAVLAIKPVTSQASWGMLVVMASVAGAFGFVIGIPFWIRDRRRGK